MVHCINDNFGQQSSIGKFSAVFELLIVHGTGFDSDLELKQIIITFFFSVLASGVFQKLLNLSLE